jgi:acetyltransferase-like isoleucine patch superfamily enzyme
VKRARKLLALAVAWMPANALRIAGYRLLGYRIGAACRIGLGTVIAVDNFACGARVSIRRGTVFSGPITVVLGDDTFIGRWNRIECGEAAAASGQAHMDYARHFETGRHCLINESHLFDVLGRISIGDGSWVAGFASQFLTHGASAMDRDITIGRGCFLGSALRFAPGSGVGDKVMVAMGAVVTKRIAGDNVVVGGVPAKVIRAREEHDGYRFEKTW